MFPAPRLHAPRPARSLPPLPRCSHSVLIFPINLSRGLKHVVFLFFMSLKGVHSGPLASHRRAKESLLFSREERCNLPWVQSLRTEPAVPGGGFPSPFPFSKGRVTGTSSGMTGTAGELRGAAIPTTPPPHRRPRHHSARPCWEAGAPEPHSNT